MAGEDVIIAIMERESPMMSSGLVTRLKKLEMVIQGIQQDACVQQQQKWQDGAGIATLHYEQQKPLDVCDAPDQVEIIHMSTTSSLPPK